MSQLTRRGFISSTAAGLVYADVAAAEEPLVTQAPPAALDRSATVGSYLATRLEQAGVRHYFVVPGDFNLVLLDQLLTNPRLKMIGCCNELNAGYAADGYARSNGLAALVVTYSVGGLSALNAVACAYAEDLPVLAIIGGINSDSGPQNRLIHHGLGEVRYQYQREIYAEVTAGSFAVEHATDAPGLIDRAIDLAIRRRKPVMLEIACNVAPLAVAPPRPKRFDAAAATDPAALADAVTHAAEVLNGAKGPALVAGSKLRSPGASEAFRALADASGYAVAVAPGGKGMFSEAHPGFVGLYWGPVSSPGVASVVESADAYLFAGTILSDGATTGFTAALDPKRMVLAMPGEIRLPGATYADVALTDFLAALATKVRRNDFSLREFRAGQKPDAPTTPPAADVRLKIEEVARQVRATLGPETALLVETGDSWFHGLETQLPEGCRFEIQFQACSIGWSVPAALGYELGLKEPRRVIAMIGAGSFQVTAQEISTMIRHRTRPIIVLVNNHGYIIEDALHEGPYNKIKNWDYAGLMAVLTHGEGAGLGLRAKTGGELAAALKTASAHIGPCLIEVDIDPTDCSPTMREWGSHVALATGKPPRP